MNFLTLLKGAAERAGKLPRFKISLLLMVAVLIGFLFYGCRGVSTVPKGWSGGAIADDILFVGSMEGKLVASNITDGSLLWGEVLESPAQPGGGFGCAPAASTTVAIYGSPAIGDGLVYVGGYNGIVYAFAFGGGAPRGEPRWVYPRQGNIGGSIVGGLVVAGNQVYFGTSAGEVYALDAVSGFKEWAFEAGDKIWSTPAVVDETLYVGSFDNKLYALRTTDGTKKWEFATDGAIVATPVIENDTVYVGSFDRYLYALDVTDGSLKWKFLAGNWFWAEPVIIDGVIYAACLDGKVYGLDAGSGNRLVEFDLGGPVSSSPVLVDNSIIVVTENGVVYALDTSNNQKRQLANLEEKVFASLAVSQDKVYVHTAEDIVYELNTQSGALREFRLSSE